MVAGYSFGTVTFGAGLSLTHTLSAGIAASSTAYMLIHATSASATLTGFSGWTVDGPYQADAGTGVTYSFLLSRAVGTADSGTTHTGTLSAGTPRWRIQSMVISSGAVVGTPVHLADATADTTTNYPAFTPGAADCDAILIAGMTSVSGQLTMAATPPTGYSTLFEDESNYGSANEIGLLFSRRAMTGQNGVLQAATTGTNTKTHRANTWAIVVQPTSGGGGGTQVAPTRVGATAVAAPAITTTAGSISFPSGSAAGDVAIISACYNPNVITTPAPAGWALQGAAHDNGNNMRTQSYTKTLVAADITAGSVSFTYSAAAKVALAMTVWRGCSYGGLGYGDASSSTSGTTPVGAVNTALGIARYETFWFERVGTAAVFDTSVTIPSGLTAGVALQSGAQSGGVSVATAFSPAAGETDGSVGAGSWVNPGTPVSADRTSVTVAMYGTNNTAQTATVWNRWTGTAYKSVELRVL